MYVMKDLKELVFNVFVRGWWLEPDAIDAHIGRIQSGSTEDVVARKDIRSLEYNVWKTKSVVTEQISVILLPFLTPSKGDVYLVLKDA